MEQDVTSQAKGIIDYLKNLEAGDLSAQVHKALERKDLADSFSVKTSFEMYGDTMQVSYNFGRNLEKKQEKFFLRTMGVELQKIPEVNVQKLEDLEMGNLVARIGNFSKLASNEEGYKFAKADLTKDLNALYKKDPQLLPAVYLNDVNGLHLNLPELKEQRAALLKENVTTISVSSFYRFSPQELHSIAEGRTLNKTLWVDTTEMDKRNAIENGLPVYDRKKTEPWLRLGAMKEDGVNEITFVKTKEWFNLEKEFDNFVVAQKLSIDTKRQCIQQLKLGKGLSFHGSDEIFRAQPTEGTISIEIKGRRLSAEETREYLHSPLSVRQKGEVMEIKDTRIGTKLPLKRATATDDKFKNKIK